MFPDNRATRETRVACYSDLSESKVENKGGVLIYICYVVQLCDKPLSDEVFLISGIIKVEVKEKVISLAGGRG